MRVPLEFRNIPPQLEIVGDPPDTVDVRLRGSSALLSRLEPGEVVAVLDLEHARPGSRMFHLRDDEVRAPYGVEVAQVMPGTLGSSSRRSADARVPVVPAHRRRAGAGLRGRPGAPRNRRRSKSSGRRAGVRARGRHDRAGDGRRRAGRRPRRGHRRVADSAVRLVQPQNATVIVEVLPAPVERELRGRAGAGAESRQRAARRGSARRS